MRQKAVRIGLKMLCHAAAILAIWLALTFSLFLGLQVRPMFGNIGLIVTALMVAAYVYLGFIRKR